MTIAATEASIALAGPRPSAKPMTMWRALRAARTSILEAVPESAYREPLTEIQVAGRHVFIVADPPGVKHVLLDNVANYPKAPAPTTFLAAAFGDGLLTSDGGKWRSHRRIMAPSFDSKSLASNAPAMAEVTQTWLAGWNAAGHEIDITREMTELTLRLISRTMFSSDGDVLCDLIGETLHRGIEAMEFPVAQFIPVVGRFWRARRIRNIHRTFSALDNGIYGLIRGREGKPPRNPPDLLDRLVAARDSETGSQMSEEEVRDEVVIIFLAGHETTAVALSFTWYLLALHSDAEATLHAELDRVLAGRMPCYDDLEKLVYTRAVIEEAMRLYPPAPGVAMRTPKEDDTVSGRCVPAGSLVAVSPWILHRHRALWNNPERFDPERFMPDRPRPQRFAYLPFGGGPRICIGASLAMMEATLILAMIAQRYRIALVPQQRIDLRTRVTLRPKDGIRMRVERR